MTNGAGLALSGVVKDCDERRLCAVAEHFVQISGAEDDGYASYEPYCGIDEIRDDQ